MRRTMVMLVNVMVTALNQIDECSYDYRGTASHDDLRGAIRGIKVALRGLTEVLDTMGDKGVK
jgi:hypothetical protein